MSKIEVPDWVTKIAEDARVHCLNAVTAYGSAGVDERYHMAMRAALTAALGAWVAQRGKTYYDTRDSSLPTQVDWNHPEPGAKENVYTMRQEKPE